MPSNITSPYDGTALIAAAHLGHAEVVRMLIAAKAPLDHVNNLGWTALIESIVLGNGGKNHTDTLEALVKAGANVNLADRNGATPLDAGERPRLRRDGEDSRRQPARNSYQPGRAPATARCRRRSAPAPRCGPAIGCARLEKPGAASSRRARPRPHRSTPPITTEVVHITTSWRADRQRLDR